MSPFDELFDDKICCHCHLVLVALDDVLVDWCSCLFLCNCHRWHCGCCSCCYCASCLSVKCVKDANPALLVPGQKDFSLITGNNQMSNVKQAQSSWNLFTVNCSLLNLTLYWKWAFCCCSANSPHSGSPTAKFLVGPSLTFIWPMLTESWWNMLFLCKWCSLNTLLQFLSCDDINCHVTLTVFILFAQFFNFCVFS